MADADSTARPNQGAALRAARKAKDVDALAQIATDAGAKPGLRLAAIKALGKAGDVRALKPLARLVHERDVTCRLATVRAIGDIGGKGAVKPLLTALDVDTPTAVCAAEALGKVASPAAVPGLVAHVGALDWKLRRGCAAALAKIGDPQAATPIRAQAERETGAQRRLLLRFANRLSK